MALVAVDIPARSLRTLPEVGTPEVGILAAAGSPVAAEGSLAVDILLVVGNLEAGILAAGGILIGVGILVETGTPAEVVGNLVADSPAVVDMLVLLVAPGTPAGLVARTVAAAPAVVQPPAGWADLLA